jgi:type II secretory ATPase GspE/PulE/Tfp pilus assembly ATPase PilB-like protein
VNTADATHTMSLMVAGSSSAQQVRVDFDLNKRMGKPVQDLGLLPAQMKLVESIVSNDEPGGVVLVAAAAGQGLTTTSLAMLARHDAFTAAVKALEKNSMHRLEGVDHQLWNPSGGVEFHTQLQSIVRRGPDVVFVDDVTDPGTGKVIASPTSSDTRFYVALPVDGVGPAITEWFRAVGDVKMAAAPLRAVVAVRMIRKLCIACRVPFQPSPEQAKRLAIPAGKAVELFRAGGKVQIKSKVEDCPLCKGTGFSGQIGVFEVVILDAEAREHLAKGDLKSAYNASRLKFKAPGMQEAALMRVREGVTSLEEVVRVFTPPAAKPAAAGAKPTAKPATPPAAGGTPPKPKA